MENYDPDPKASPDVRNAREMARMSWRKEYEANRKRPAEYGLWSNMKQRCLNPKNKNYHNYGGRGIRVCERWLKSYEHFIEDMGPKPKGFSIERINNDGNYEPGNCKWIHPSQQHENRRNSLLVTHNGVTQTAGAWDREKGFSQGTVYGRISVGWTHAEAIDIPQRGRGALQLASVHRLLYRIKQRQALGIANEKPGIDAVIKILDQLKFEVEK